MGISVPAVLGMAVSVVGLMGGAAAAEPWRSGLDGQTVVTIEKRNRADHRLTPCPDCGLRGAEALEALPADVLSRAGGNAVEYESFLITHLPEPAARALAEAARARGLAVGLGGDREIRLPWHSFEPDKPAGRNDPRVVRDVPADAVPGLYLVQFAYPIRQEWLAELEACGVQPIAYFQSQTFLVRAATQDKATRCRKVERYLAWSDDFRASDRLAAGLLDQPSPLGYMLQYIYGTDLTAKSLELAAAGATVESRWEPAQDRVAYLHIQAPPDLLRQIAATDPDLLSAYAASEAGPSDERQGNIVAGLHNGATLCGPVGSPSCPHYGPGCRAGGFLPTPTSRSWPSWIPVTMTAACPRLRSTTIRTWKAPSGWKGSMARIPPFSTVLAMERWWLGLSQEKALRRFSTRQGWPIRRGSTTAQGLPPRQ